MRQRSQAFQTRLCLPSMPAACVRWSWWWTEAAEPERLGARCWGLTDFVPLAELFFVEEDMFCLV